MRGRIPLGSRCVISATAERISRCIRRRAFRKCVGSCHAALHARILRIRARAVGHDVRAVCRAHGRATAAGAAAAAAAARAVVGAVTATERENGNRTKQNARNKDASFRHLSSVSRLRFGRQHFSGGKTVTHSFRRLTPES